MKTRNSRSLILSQHSRTHGKGQTQAQRTRRCSSAHAHLLQRRDMMAAGRTRRKCSWHQKNASGRTRRKCSWHTKKRIGQNTAQVFLAPKKRIGQNTAALMQELSRPRMMCPCLALAVSECMCVVRLSGTYSCLLPIKSLHCNRHRQNTAALIQGKRRYLRRANGGTCAGQTAVLGRTAWSGYCTSACQRLFFWKMAILSTLPYRLKLSLIHI